MKDISIIYGELLMELEFCAPCLFGLEGPVGNELRHMGLKDVRAQDGRVYFKGTERDIAGVNIRSRFAERALIVVGRTRAGDFDSLFEGVRAMEWERYIPRNGAFPVKGYTHDSAITSMPALQRSINKAVAERLGGAYGLERLPETGETYQIQFALVRNEATLYIDTSGPGLHKRGYRPTQVEAPLRETLAAALVDIAGYRGRGDMCDPFCGSGTIAIEAALAAKNRAPGINRTFAAESWRNLRIDWEGVREEAREREFDRDYRIMASDLNPEAVEAARRNARRAGVEKLIRFSVADARKFHLPTDGGIIVTNPPYGERLMDLRAAQELMGDFSRAMKDAPGWQVNIISSDLELERSFGRRAKKVRKLYNGMIKCGYFMF